MEQFLRVIFHIATLITTFTVLLVAF